MSRPHPNAITSRSPVLHAAAPINGPLSSAISFIRNVAPPAQQHLPQKANEVHNQMKDREEVLRNSDNINPRYNVKAMKDKLQDLQLKPVRNQHFLQQNQLNIMGDYIEEGKYDDDYDDDDDDNDDDDDEGDEEDEGKWNGRNKNDNVEDVAVEEDDGNGDREEDDFALEDVGGEKLKKNHRDDIKLSKKKKKKKKEKRLIIEENKDVVEYANHIGERLDADNNDEMKANKLKDLKDKFVFIEDEADVQDTEQELNLRKSRVREVCAKYKLGPYAPAGEKPLIKHPPTPNYDVFYIDRQDELAWCPVYKAASTSWLHNFLILGGVDEKHMKNTKDQISHLARKVWPSLDYKDAEKAFRSCLKFMIVRHPFERLVSAYRDKLENTNIGKEHGVEHFYKKYGRKIVAKYRPPGKGLPAIRYSQDMDDPSIPAPKGIEPTFGEFVKYIIATDLVYYADDHWMPYYLHCTPCLLDYDVIAKFETLERDQTYIIKEKHLESKIKPSWKHLTNGIKTADTIKKYFATITKKDLMGLYEKYKLDFELFGYSIDEYLSYVRDTE
ncbi:hypothetical protein SK128_015664 [Halocaridina rubra]|uniref:Carbohydrate sulfotransferase n=1 Tax=Halocaridina rubra TaxID=373956 RepID=A0AAN8ZRB3_HALRR